MSEEGLDVIACAIWKAKNNADPTSDPLAAHFMLQESQGLRPEARKVVQALRQEGYAVVGKAMLPKTADDILKPMMTRARDTDIIEGVKARLREMYEASMRDYERDLNHPMIRGIVQNHMTKQAEGSSDPSDRRSAERAVGLICQDLTHAGYRVMPTEPPHNLMDTVVFKNAKKAISLVFGEDEGNIANLYRQLVDLQRIK